MKNKLIPIKYFTLIIFFLLISGNAALAFSSNLEDITLKMPTEDLVVDKNDFKKWFINKPSMTYDSSYNSEIENIQYCPVSKIFCALTKTEKVKYTLKKVETITLDKKAVTIFLENLSKKYDRAPQDATFTVTDGRVSNFSLSQNGYQLDIEKSLQDIDNFFSQTPASNTLKISFNTLEPNIKDNDADKLGIETLIGEGKSNFTGSTLSRIHNIKVATKRFDGLLIKPGEEFSFVKNLGEVDGEHGYKQELVIKKGVTEPEFGGGVCQVSTTAFRAAIYSGLEITARRNHAYAVHYYAPQGMDSTVYIPNPDLRFKNNTPGHILIKTELDVEKKTLIFRFYGTNDGRKTEIDGPHVLSREPDGAMKTVFYQKVTDAKGNTFINEDFKSSYNSPNDYPKPGEILTSKPKNWSSKEWSEYKKDNKL
ncbi:MAG: VanW family protein [Candidatus Moranbacteria bacterium GW2011_GWE1_35_17]|nr:MAG: VanW family protein [Candidatus Moranbacteria bacterium GW2011_GWE1_35_17]KKP81435.1 MAG: VanW family protein [Candidatus Moranbacteria bacterium GW2011_GWF1_35_5]